MVLDFNECTLPLFKLLLRQSDYSRFFFPPFHLLLFFLSSLIFLLFVFLFYGSIVWVLQIDPCKYLQLWSSPKFSFSDYYGRLNKM